MNNMSKFRLFRRTRDLEGQIDEFLDNLSESAVMFRLGVRTYLKDGANSEFKQKLKAVNKLESDADELRRTIEKELYTHTLIPDARGDVLGLIETLDTLLNLLEGALWAIAIEKPEIPEEFGPGFRKLTNMVVQAADALVLAARSFFRSPHTVGDYNHKVLVYEKEADKISTQLKQDIFDSDLNLSRKIHLRNFVEQIDNVADWAEDVADRLAIYAIKRTV
jgi:predicted phosphate transport protein (TIGR00153 family)